MFYMSRLIGNMGNVTIKDIAGEAGVSVSVVSAIINKKDNHKIFVGKKKKQVVLELIEKHDFIPRKSARALASKKTNTIGIIFNSLSPFFATLLSSIQKEVLKRGLDVITYITYNSPQKEEEYLNLMRDGRVDGVITAARTKGSPERYRKFFSSYHLRIVTITPFMENIPGVHFEGREAGRLAARHLIERGCRRLCFFGGWKELARIKGFREYIKEEHLPESLLFTCEGFRDDFPLNQKLAKEFFKLKPLPDGVLAINDLAGVSLLSEALRKGLKVPEDIAIMGIDNTEICEYAYPSLTSIDLGTELRAELALEKLIKLIEGEPLGELHTKVPFKLVVRESTKDLRKKDGALNREMPGE